MEPQVTGEPDDKANGDGVEAMGEQDADTAR